MVKIQIPKVVQFHSPVIPVPVYLKLLRALHSPKLNDKVRNNIEKVTNFKRDIFSFLEKEEGKTTPDLSWSQEAFFFGKIGLESIFEYFH